MSVLTQPEAVVSMRKSRLSPALLLALYWLPVVLTCVWVLSLPVFPSQDGPLHLYYVNILRQLLAHQPGVYADTYYIKSYVTPYSAYYYGLLTLGRFVSLEVADKLMVCLYIVAFASATRKLLRAVSGEAGWSSFLCLPVLLNWPLMMGFINYSLSTCLAFLALAAWCSGIGQTRLQSRVLFLLLLCLMMVTHPVPWMIVVSFAFLELSIRLLRSLSFRYKAGAVHAMRSFRQDLVTAALACLPYVYLHHFSRVVQTLEPAKIQASPRLTKLFPPFLLTYADRAMSFLYTFGINVFAGGSLLPRIYRGGIVLLLLATLAAGIWGVISSCKSNEWTPANTWLVFSLLLLPFLLFLPDPLQDRYFFAARMGILFFVGAVASASVTLRRNPRLGMTMAGLCYLFCFFNLGLALRYITPVARALETIRQAPAPASGNSLPGLSMLPPGAGAALGLNYIPDNWGTARYFRQNNLVLFNTAWLGDPIILVGVRPDRLQNLDASYFESVPWFGSQLLHTESATAKVLQKVGFVILMRQNASLNESPFAEKKGQTSPGPYARGWQCTQGEARAWYLCQRIAAEERSPTLRP